MKVPSWDVKRDVTLWLDVDSGHYMTDDGAAHRHDGSAVTVAGVLRYAELHGATRVMLTGATIAREWFLTLVDGWEHGSHHLDHETPTGRYVSERGHRVEVRRAAEWFGAGDYTPREAHAAEAMTRALLYPRGGHLFKSPGATGLDLWLRSSRGEVPEPLALDVQEELRATTPQHRIELLPRNDEYGDTAPGLWVMDGRWMYAALTKGLGSGPAHRLTGDEAAAFFARDPYARARYRVTFKAPDDWPPLWPGLLMARAGEDVTDGWHAPRAGTTWADAAEVYAAASYDWHLTFHEAVTFTPGRPLDAWTTQLVRAREAALPPVADGRSREDVVHRMVRGAVRTVLLHAIGSWHAAGADETTVTASPMMPPAGDGWGAPERLENGSVLWRRRSTKPNARRDSLRHPEWSAQVWGRAHARMIDCPTGAKSLPAGMLHTPYGALVGMYGDALMLAARPAWADLDDGRPGRLRVKGHICGPVAWPTTARERDALTKAAEAAGTTCAGRCER